MAATKTVLIYIFILTTSIAPGTLSADKRWPNLDVLKPQTSPDVQAATVTDMLRRLLKDRANEFSVSVDPSLGPTDKDTYRLENGAGRTIKVTGSSGVAAALGLHYYLKQWCGCHVSWSGNQLNVRKPLPAIPAPVQVTTQDRFRYYQNVCTVSYSSVWWKWERWEQEIDWMALNGINLPLAFTGQEAMWWRVYESLGFSADEIQEFFSGPAFFAWQRMGNLDGWGGPLSRDFANSQLALQHQILKRMRDFGIIPVLPAFSGHVPRSIKQRFPSANVTQLSKWNKFNATYCCTYLLNPTDPLVQNISNSFMVEMKRELGLNHIYNTDVFNEMTPTSADPHYLQAIGAAVYSGMTETDPEAIWLMQGWLFNSPFWKPAQAKALLTSVPLGKMMILDLQAELTAMYSRYESFYGQPFIWCMLHNFGGVLGMYGAIQNVNTLPFKGRAYPNSTMVGTGLTMEGIFQNDVMYEFMNEMAWRSKPVNLKMWFTNYSTCRYGSHQQNAAKAWNILKSSVYNCTDGYKHHGGYVIVKRPSLKLAPIIWYRSQDLLAAWDLMVSNDVLNESSTYRYDLTDITREVLQTLANQFYVGLTQAFAAKNVSEFEASGSKLLDLLNDMEILLAANDHFLLGHWLEDAKALSQTDDDKILLEYNARNQITLWGPDGNIVDYAAKQWSGLFKSYYIPRWQLFIDMITQCLKNKTPFKQDKFKQLVFSQVEQPFTFDRTSFPTTPTGDTIDIVKNLHKKWRQTANQKVLRRVAKKHTSRMIKTRWSKIHARIYISSNELF